MTTQITKQMVEELRQSVRIAQVEARATGDRTILDGLAAELADMDRAFRKAESDAKRLKAEAARAERAANARYQVHPYMQMTITRERGFHQQQVGWGVHDMTTGDMVAHRDERAAADRIALEHNLSA